MQTHWWLEFNAEFVGHVKQPEEEDVEQVTQVESHEAQLIPVQ